LPNLACGEYTLDGSASGKCAGLLLNVIRWDEFCMAHSATTINENGVPWQYAMPGRVVQRSSALLVLESPWMSLTRAALFYQGKVQELGVLQNGDVSTASGINDASAVVGASGPYSEANRAFVWTASKGMRDLNTLIRSNSGWVLMNATAINSKGQIIGDGRFNGNPRGFLLTPR